MEEDYDAVDDEEEENYHCRFDDAYFRYDEEFADYY